jgi:hypothetical protein
MNTTLERESATLGLSLPGVDPLIIQQLIGELIGLLQGCFPDPTPDAALEWVNSGGSRYGFIGQWMWRRTVSRAVARAWTGDRAVVGIVQDAVLRRLQSGITRSTLMALYAGG